MFALQTLAVAVRNLFVGEMMRQRVLEELGSMSGRELADLGISRFDFKRLANEAAQDAVRDVATGSAAGHGPRRLAGNAQTV